MAHLELNVTARNLGVVFDDAPTFQTTRYHQPHPKIFVRLCHQDLNLFAYCIVTIVIIAIVPLAGLPDTDISCHQDHNLFADCIATIGIIAMLPQLASQTQIFLSSN